MTCYTRQASTSELTSQIGRQMAASRSGLLESPFSSSLAANQSDNQYNVNAASCSDKGSTTANSIAMQRTQASRGKFSIASAPAAMGAGVTTAKQAETRNLASVAGSGQVCIAPPKSL